MPSILSILMTYFRSFSALLQFPQSHCRSSQELLRAPQLCQPCHEPNDILGLRFLLAAFGNVRKTLRDQLITTAYHEPKRHTCCGSRASEHTIDFDPDTTSESTRTNSTVITNRTGQNQFGEALGRRLAHEDPSQPHTLLRPHQ